MVKNEVIAQIHDLIIYKMRNTRGGASKSFQYCSIILSPLRESIVDIPLCLTTSANCLAPRKSNNVARLVNFLALELSRPYISFECLVLPAGNPYPAKICSIWCSFIEYNSSIDLGDESPEGKPPSLHIMGYMIACWERR